MRENGKAQGILVKKKINNGESEVGSTWVAC